jgi:hypothetical protein
MFTGEKRNSRTETCPSAIRQPQLQPKTGLGKKTGLCDEKPTKHLSHSRASRISNCTESVQQFRTLHKWVDTSTPRDLPFCKACCVCDAVCSSLRTSDATCRLVRRDTVFDRSKTASMSLTSPGTPGLARIFLLPSTVLCSWSGSNRI